ncbi:MAG: ribonuclease Z [Tannerella sp.]|jgi:ribonuclease Z|nr:ribonuclease Z [Tannerella sp.]
MARFEITLLGCGSATVTLRHAATSQVVDLRDKLYLIDCGEGTQLQMRRMHVRFSRLNHIFISHLHGDHCFGLPGLISTLGMLGRKGELVIHGPQALEDFLRPVLTLFCRNLPYPVRLNLIDPGQHAVVMEDRSLCVRSIPLKHRIPTCGYLFAEKPSEPHLIREMTDFYRIPVKELARLKQGADYVTPEGEVIPNSRLTRPADPPKRYAYCSDTAFAPEIVPWIEGCDCLYHEATFIEADLPRARETFHSTARQAAEIARRAQVKRLVIGHYSARYEDPGVLRAEAEAVFPGTVAGMEGMKLSLIEKKQGTCAN